MHPIICQNELGSIIDKIQEYVDSGRIIKGIRLVDYTGDQVVILLSEESIEQKIANAWWSGFNAFLGQEQQ